MELFANVTYVRPLRNRRLELSIQNSCSYAFSFTPSFVENGGALTVISHISPSR